MDHSYKHEDPTLSRGNWVLIGFLIIAGFFLFTEHRAHLLGILPYMLILACPLMHLVWFYARLAKAEERDSITEFDGEYERYRGRTPAFFPRFRNELSAL